MTLEDNRSDTLIVVNEDDEVTGHLPKLECHLGDGILHRAFSVFLFNSDGELLLQQRSAEKFLWPMYWSNSCCSHPRENESIASAATRRVREELGVECQVDYLYKFQYQARYADVGSENELCSVLAGTHSGEIKVDPKEIADWRFVTPTKLTEEIETDGERFTPWLKLEWQQITQRYLEDILKKVA